MHVFKYMHYITSFDVAISVMQADGLQNNFDAKTVAFNIIFVCKTSKKEFHSWCTRSFYIWA